MLWLGRALIDGWVVTVAVDDLPFAVLPAVEVGDAERVGRDRAAVDGRRGVFVAHRVGQVSTRGWSANSLNPRCVPLYRRVVSGGCQDLKIPE